MSQYGHDWEEPTSWGEPTFWEEPVSWQEHAKLLSCNIWCQHAPCVHLVLVDSSWVWCAVLPIGWSGEKVRIGEFADVQYVRMLVNIDR
jgi:hypothetical protein